MVERILNSATSHFKHSQYIIPYIFFRTLRKLMEDNQDTWDDYVEGTVFTINTNESTTTKYSPFFLMYGRNPRLPFEVGKLEQPPQALKT